MLEDEIAKEILKKEKKKNKSEHYEPRLNS
jgi:hypothetical protein